MKRIFFSLYVPEIFDTTKLLATYLEVPLDLIFLTSEKVIDGEIYPVQNWRFIFDLIDDA